MITINRHGVDRVLRGHPWVFKSDVSHAGNAEAGSIVQISQGKKFLAQAIFNPRSQITLRIVSRRQEDIDRGFWKRRLQAAIARRNLQHAGCRLVFGEVDQIPGLIIDRYGDVVVFQTLSLGQEKLKEMWIDLIDEILHPKAIVERNDPSSRKLEGLGQLKGVVRGSLPAPLTINEAGKVIIVDPLEGHKTGLYLDQAENRIAVKHFTKGKTLDLFCYQGAFAIHLAEAALEVVAVDSSAPALGIAEQNLERNGIKNVSLAEANVFDYLRELESRGERFDTILLDPPPFVSSRKDVAGGLRGYKEINLRAMKILNPGGVLITCSCSQNFSEGMFFDMLTDAAIDTHRGLQIVERRGAAPDHPVLLSFPESMYLQCWITRVL